MTQQPWPTAEDVLATVCAVMEVAAEDIPGKTTPRTKPRLQWARNMAAFVMHDLGLSDGAIARSCGDIHRVTIMVRRKRMAEKLETSQRYRDHHAAILSRLASSRTLATQFPDCPRSWTKSSSTVSHHPPA